MLIRLSNMKIFTHFFRLIDPAEISCQWRQFVTLTEGARPAAFMASDPVSFTQEVRNDDNGVYYAQNFSAVAADPAVKKFSGRYAVIEMALSDGSVCYMGTKEDPVKIAVTPYPDRFLLSAECASGAEMPL